MIEAKKLGKDKKDEDKNIRVKNYRFRHRCYNCMPREESKSNKMTIDEKYGQDG